LTFVLQSAEGIMDVTYAQEFTQLTRKTPPVITGSSLDQPIYNKNDFSNISSTYTSINNAEISALIINANIMPINSSSSSLFDAVVTQDVGNVAMSTEYIITGFTYFDGVQQQTINYSSGNFVTLPYIVAGDIPIATVDHVLPSPTSVGFDVVILDIDNSLVADSVKAELYAHNDTTTPLQTLAIPVIGKVDNQFTNLTMNTAYDI